MKHVNVVNRLTGEVVFQSARWCSSRLCRLIGLQFRRRLRPGEALLMAWRTESIARTSIHMFFVLFPLAAIWVNKAGRVTSVQLARPWRPYYASPEPACYVIEASPEFLERISVGDEVDFV